MIKGTLVKAISGFYEVIVGDVRYVCKARGLFKKNNESPLVGDQVWLEVLDDEAGTGRIEKIEPRRNVLYRPAIANVDQALIVFAGMSPDPHPVFLDKLLVLILKEGIRPVLCMNKADLPYSEAVSQLVADYRRAGFDVLETSSETGIGLEALRAQLRGRISVLAGPSGAGKSTLLNALDGSFCLKTGGLSRKIERGKHTTRHTELFSVEGGLVADTPGFTSMELRDLPRESLWQYFPEFARMPACRFNNCLHMNEPDCEVLKGLESGELARSRYESYHMFMEELEAQEQRRYR